MKPENSACVSLIPALLEPRYPDHATRESLIGPKAPFRSSVHCFTDNNKIFFSIFLKLGPPCGKNIADYNTVDDYFSVRIR